jgi:hypothetical protein
MHRKMQSDRHNHPPPGRPHAAEHELPRVGIEAPSSEVLHAQDHWRVNLAEDWEVTFWSREFACSADELKRAVEAVGANAGAVRAYLSSQVQQQRS